LFDDRRLKEMKSKEMKRRKTFFFMSKISELMMLENKTRNSKHIGNRKTFFSTY